MDATQLAAAERLSGQVQFQLMDATDLTLEPASFDAVWLFVFAALFVSEAWR